MCYNGEGFVNRHTNKLPDKITTMRVVKKDFDGEHIYLCEWKPSHSKENDGYLGTAKVIEGIYTGIGFHAWEQNNSEFVWYAIE